MTDSTLIHIVFVSDGSGAMDPLHSLGEHGLNRILVQQANQPISEVDFD